ncbi:hypothetical protein [Lentzea sp. NPDC060358]|uniref:hypothetical protein n=1 Tax=Lentzea sp. NPDC060358 TaxID=3347103 RepID=UPI003667D4CF
MRAWRRWSVLTAVVAGCWVWPAGAPDGHGIGDARVWDAGGLASRGAAWLLP